MGNFFYNIKEELIMSMVIGDDSSMLKAINGYNNTNSAIGKTMLKLTSGLKINSVVDDPTNWAINERMQEKIRSLNQADTNTQTDISLLKTAEGAISNTIDIIQTLKARAINSANDHNTDNEREQLQYETKLLLDQIDKNATATTFNGMKLLDGSKSVEGLTFHIGGEANFFVNLTLDSMTVDSLGLSGLDISTREGAVAALGVLDPSTGTYVDSITDPTTGETKRGILDTALQKALNQQAKIGAWEERLGFNRDVLSNAIENTTAASSTIVDSNLASEMSKFVELNIRAQASQYILSQMNQHADSVLDLLVPIQ